MATNCARFIGQSKQAENERSIFERLCRIVQQRKKIMQFYIAQSTLRVEFAHRRRRLVNWDQISRCQCHPVSCEKANKEILNLR